MALLSYAICMYLVLGGRRIYPWGGGGGGGGEVCVYCAIELVVHVHVCLGGVLHSLIAIVMHTMIMWAGFNTGGKGKGSVLSPPSPPPSDTKTSEISTETFTVT